MNSDLNYVNPRGANTLNFMGPRGDSNLSPASPLGSGGASSNSENSMVQELHNEENISKTFSLLNTSEYGHLNLYTKIPAFIFKSDPVLSGDNQSHLILPINLLNVRAKECYYQAKSSLLQYYIGEIKKIVDENTILFPELVEFKRYEGSMFQDSVDKLFGDSSNSRRKQKQLMGGVGDYTNSIVDQLKTSSSTYTSHRSDLDKNSALHSQDMLGDQVSDFYSKIHSDILGSLLEGLPEENQMFQDKDKYKTWVNGDNLPMFVDVDNLDVTGRLIELNYSDVIDDIRSELKRTESTTFNRINNDEMMKLTSNYGMSIAVPNVTYDDDSTGFKKNINEIYNIEDDDDEDDYSSLWTSNSKKTSSIGTGNSFGDLKNEIQKVIGEIKIEDKMLERIKMIHKVKEDIYILLRKYFMVSIKASKKTQLSGHSNFTSYLTSGGIMDNFTFAGIVHTVLDSSAEAFRFGMTKAKSEVCKIIMARQAEAYNIWGPKLVTGDRLYFRIVRTMNPRILNDGSNIDNKLVDTIVSSNIGWSSYGHFVLIPVVKRNDNTKRDVNEVSVGGLQNQMRYRNSPIRHIDDLFQQTHYYDIFGKIVKCKEIFVGTVQYDTEEHNYPLIERNIAIGLPNNSGIVADKGNAMKSMLRLPSVVIILADSDKTQL